MKRPGNRKWGWVELGAGEWKLTFRGENAMENIDRLLMCWPEDL